MYDMIEKLVQRDKQARESLNEVKKRKMNSAQKIAAIKEQIRGEYLEKARANIKNIEKTERMKLQEKLAEIESTYEVTTQKVEKTYSERKSEWVEMLFNRVLEV